MKHALTGAAAYLVGFALAGALPWAATLGLRPELAPDFLEALLELPLGGLALAAALLGALFGAFHASVTLRTEPSSAAWIPVGLLRAGLSMPLAMATFPLAIVASLFSKSEPAQAGKKRKKQAGGPAKVGAALVPFLPLVGLAHEKERANAIAAARALTRWLVPVLALYVLITQVATYQGIPRVTNTSFERERIARLEAGRVGTPMSAPVALAFGTVGLGEYLLTLVVVRELARRARQAQSG